MAKMIDSTIAVTRVRVNSNCSCPVTYVLFRIFFCRRMPCILFIISKSRMCEKESQLDEYSLKMTHHDIKAAFITSPELMQRGRVRNAVNCMTVTSVNLFFGTLHRFLSKLFSIDSVLSLPIHRASYPVEKKERQKEGMEEGISFLVKED